jgi:RNA polymerase sigma factor (TIGR02999 family)
MEPTEPPVEARERVTRLLAVGAGRETLDALLPLVYDELRQVARRQLGHEWRGRPLGTTELVHEAYLRLIDEGAVPLRNRAYFFAAAAQAMRRVLVDAARRRQRAKRGGGAAAVTLDEERLAVDGFSAELLDLDGGLERLAARFPRQAQVVECRFFAGLGVEETAAALQLAPRTVKRDWALARAWLYRELVARDG